MSLFLTKYHAMKRMLRLIKHHPWRGTGGAEL